MRKTFEQILKERPDLDLSGSAFDELIYLFQQVREETIKECMELSKIKFYAGESGYLDSKVIDQLNKHSIEIYEI
jgi:hypothetical protein